jgi:hypothetical protein
MSDSKKTESALLSLRANLQKVSDKEEVDATRQRLTTLKQNLNNLADKELSNSRENLTDLRKKLEEMENRDFSFFKILGIEENESVHSNFLAWLLTPQEHHGLGTVLIEKMLQRIASKEGYCSLDGVDFSKLVVKREESGETGRLDIRIFDPDGLFQCIIENKIRSGEVEKQTNRYYEEWSGYYQKELFVFLTLDQYQKPLKENYVCLHYDDIRELILELQPTSNDTKHLIKNYLHTLEGLILAAKFQRFSEKSKLYFQFYKEISDVSKEWDKDRQLLLSTLEQELKACLSKAWIVEKTGSNICIYKKEWHPESGRGISFYLEPIKSEAAMELSVYGKPYDFNSDYVDYFKKSLNDGSGKKRIEEFRKSLTGGSLNLKKTLPLVQEDPVPMIITKVKEMVTDFETIIDRSMVEFKKATNVRV